MVELIEPGVTDKSWFVRWRAELRRAHNPRVLCHLLRGVPLEDEGGQHGRVPHGSQGVVSSG